MTAQEMTHSDSGAGSCLIVIPGKMEGYRLLRTLHTPSVSRVSIAEGEQTSSQAPVLLTTWKCAHVQEANQVLQSVLRKLRGGGDSRQCLAAVLDKPAEAGLLVTFVWQCQEELTNADFWLAEESRFQAEAQGSHIEEELQQTVTVWRLQEWKDANPLLTVLMLSAGAENRHIQPTLSVAVSVSETGSLTLSAVTAHMSTDLDSDMKARRERGHAYTERDILTVLGQASHGLLWAKSRVSLTQGVPHRNLSLSSILLSSSGDYYLSGFQCQSDHCANKSVYCSPELLANSPATEVDYFAADVFSLGVCVLNLALLRPVARTGNETDSELRQLLRRELTQVRYSPSLKRLIEVMVITKPTLRADLASVQSDPVPGLLAATAVDCFVTGLREQEDCRFEVAAWHMQKAWESLLHDGSDLPTLVTVGQQLGTLLGVHLSRFSEARQVLETCSAVTTDADSTEAISLRASLIGLSFYSDEYEDAERDAHCFFDLFNLSPETYWTVAYYLVMSLWRLKKNEEAEAAFVSLSQRPFDEESFQATAQRLNLHAWVQLDAKQFIQAEQTRLMVEEICREHCPSAMVAAENYRSWAYLCEDRGQLEEAAHKHKCAHRIFAVQFPANINTARNLHKWTHICTLIGQPEEAAQHNRDSAEICSEFFPERIHTANSFADWADYCDSTGKAEESVQHYARAHLIYFVGYPWHGNTGHNLYNWALAMKTRNAAEKAEGKFVACYRVYCSARVESAQKDAIASLRTLY